LCEPVVAAHEKFTARHPIHAFRAVHAVAFDCRRALGVCRCCSIREGIVRGTEGKARADPQERMESAFPYRGLRASSYRHDRVVSSPQQRQKEQWFFLLSLREGYATRNVHKHYHFGKVLVTIPGRGHFL
jgi:hypothetical protein